uniref:Proline rich membrane anchor 1 n=1 Tax=Dromaius novaehollandiae TaxID=8790 RepID=A0A8C4KIF5_DRONO
ALLRQSRGFELTVLLKPFWGHVTQGEPQKSCSKPVAEKVTESCQQICQCRPPPPLPPPPPPPPPPRLLVVPTPKSTFCPTEETWWPGLVIIIAVCCATLVFLFIVVIICYKHAIKWLFDAFLIVGHMQINAYMVERSLWTLKYHFRMHQSLC